MNKQTANFYLILIFVAALAAEVNGQTASALVRESEPLPGDTMGTMVSAINNPATNGVGGFAFTVTTDGSFGNVWGNLSGGSGTVLFAEDTIGDLDITGLESFFGISDTGNACYGTTTTDLVSGTTGLDGVFLDDMLVLNEEEAVPTLPGQFSTFNSRPGITAAGQPYWVGGISVIQGGGSQDRVLFLGTDLEPVIRGGDAISGIPESLVMGSSIDFDVRFSACGSNYIMAGDVDSDVNTDIVLISNGAAIEAGGTVIREGNLIPVGVGGLGDAYDNFDSLGIAENGNYMITGDTDGDVATDEFVFLNGQIAMREGEVVDGDTISGAIEGAAMNEDGDWAAIWDADTDSGNVEVLILNGGIILREGDAVDWNGDGVIDANDMGATLSDFNGISALAISRPNTSSGLRIYFAADVLIAEQAVEGGFVIEALGNPIVIGDVNGDQAVNLLDVAPFVKTIETGIYAPGADINEDGSVDLLDVGPFIDVLNGGGGK